MGQTLVVGIVDGSIYALIAAGLVLVYQGSGVLNFAQAEVGTLTLYVAWLISGRGGAPYALGALGAVAAAVAIGVAFQRLVVRPLGQAPKVVATVATTGLLTLTMAIELVAFGPSPRLLPAPVGGRGVVLAGVVVSPTQLLTLVVVPAIAVALAAFLRYTDFGLGVLASAQDGDAARLMGVPSNRVSMFTWGAAGALSAVAALLIEPTVEVIAPGALAGLFIGGLAAALVGGLTSLPGAFVGGLLVGVVEALVRAQLLSSSFPGAVPDVLFGLIMVILLVRPRGVLSR